jgi:hypothetical protein
VRSGLPRFHGHRFRLPSGSLHSACSLLPPLLTRGSKG